MTSGIFVNTHRAIDIDAMSLNENRTAICSSSLLLLLLLSSLFSSASNRPRTTINVFFIHVERPGEKRVDNVSDERETSPFRPIVTSYESTQLVMVMSMIYATSRDRISFDWMSTKAGRAHSWRSMEFLSLIIKVRVRCNGCQQHRLYFETVIVDCTHISPRFTSLTQPTGMSVSSDDIRDSRALHVYRLPPHARRSRAYHDRAAIPHVRSPSADSTVIVSRRRHSSPRSTVRIVEVQSPEPPTYVKRYYPSARTRRVIRERSPLSITPDSASSIGYPPPLTLAQRRLPEQRVVRLATASTSASSRTDLIVPVARRSRRAFVERPVAIVSETPLVNRGTSPRKQWKKRETTIPLDVHRDVYISDEDYYEEAFPDGVSETLFKVIAYR